MEYKRVVVTGMGVVAPGAKNVPQFNDLLRSGRSAIEYDESLAAANFECQVSGIASSELDLSDPILRYHEVELANEFIRLATMAALEAWRDAGLKVPDPEDETVDYTTGAVIGGIAPGLEVDVADKIVGLTQKGNVRRLGSSIIPNLMPSGAVAYISSIFAAGSYSYALSSACSTGLDSILNGFGAVATGYAKRMIVGASESYSKYVLAGFDSMRVMNRTSNHQPEKASRPMSTEAYGFVPGSGAGVMILEDLETARARGARIYAELYSGAVSCGAQRSGGTMTFPNKYGVLHCIKTALGRHNFSSKDIDYINGHLSGTTADLLELENWQEALNCAREDFPYINSTKSMIGHCLGAAGALESIATVLQMYHGYIHASLNTEDLHPKIEEIAGREKVPLQMIERDINLAAKASFGFGDVNSVLIFKKYQK